MKKEYTAGLIVFRKTEQGPRFLLLYHGGRYWNFPKGHIEQIKDAESIWNAPDTSDATSAEITETETTERRETSREAAIRETFEESGIRNEDIDIAPGFRAVQRFTFKKGHDQILKVVVFYLAETKKPDVKISSEHEGYGWFLYRDARYILGLHKDMQALLKRAYDEVRKNDGYEPKKEYFGTKEQNINKSPVLRTDNRNYGYRRSGQGNTGSNYKPRGPVGPTRPIGQAGMPAQTNTPRPNSGNPGIDRTKSNEGNDRGFFDGVRSR